MDPNSEIIAVSGRRIDDPTLAAARLETLPTDRFTLLVDEHGETFRAFNCYKDHPLHGLFLIDREGIIRASYIGETPFDDLSVIIERVNALADTRPKAELR